MVEAGRIARRLLALDDDPKCTDLVVRTALKCGYEAFPSNDERMLRQSIEAFRPDVLTLDLCMPELDAIEVFPLLRAARFRGRLIIISGQPDWLREQAKAIASEHGLNVSAHMEKPINLGELRTLLTVIRVGLIEAEERALATDSTMEIVRPVFTEARLK